MCNLLMYVTILVMVQHCGCTPRDLIRFSVCAPRVGTSSFCGPLVPSASMTCHRYPNATLLTLTLFDQIQTDWTRLGDLNGCSYSGVPPNQFGPSLSKELFCGYGLDCTSHSDCSNLQWCYQDCKRCYGDVCSFYGGDPVSFVAREGDTTCTGSGGETSSTNSTNSSSSSSSESSALVIVVVVLSALLLVVVVVAIARRRHRRHRGEGATTRHATDTSPGNTPHNNNNLYGNLGLLAPSAAAPLAAAAGGAPGATRSRRTSSSSSRKHHRPGYVAPAVDAPRAYPPPPPTPPTTPAAYNNLYMMPPLAPPAGASEGNRGANATWTPTNMAAAAAGAVSPRAHSAPYDVPSSAMDAMATTSAASKVPTLRQLPPVPIARRPTVSAYDHVQRPMAL
jgi:hypothetical protein